MSRREQLLQVIEQHIHEDCADYQALVHMLDGLYEQLMRRDCLLIEQSNQCINAKLEQLATRAAWRVKALKAFGLKANDAAMQRIFAQYPAERAERLAAAWQSLNTLAQTCKTQNERNGRLLAMHNEILSQLLVGEQTDSVYQSQYY